MVVVVADVRAAHRVDRVELADAFGGPSAGELGDGREAAAGCHAVAMESESVDLREEDGILAGWFLGGGPAVGESWGGEKREDEEEGGDC